MVVIPDGNQVAQLEVTSQRARLARDTLHQAAIAKEAVCVVVNKLVTRLVECGRGVSLSNGKTDSVGDTLAKRTSGDLNAGGIVSLGMAGCDAVNVLVGSPSQHLPLDTSIDPAAYTEGLEIVKGEVIAIEVKESILEHASVAVTIRSVSQFGSRLPCIYWRRGVTYERMNLSRLCHLGFLGLNLMNRFQRTCATGAMPLETILSASRLDILPIWDLTYIGAPGWPELALAVASACKQRHCKSIDHFVSLRVVNDAAASERFIAAHQV
jgi:hypothetical protein